ncbi:MAG: ThuA domain-containing protein [Singulisphaera sp.]
MGVSLAHLDEADAGLSDAALDATDTLVWWGRLRHDDLPEAAPGRSSNGSRRAAWGSSPCMPRLPASKPFKRLMDTSCEPGNWRDDGRPEHVSVQTPNHPIAHGVPAFTIPRTAMYAEPFAVPTPETVVFVSSWDRGETFRSGLTWTVDRGRVVYFRPGNDSFPVLFHPSVRKVIANAALRTARRTRRPLFEPVDAASRRHNEEPAGRAGGRREFRASGPSPTLLLHAGHPVQARARPGSRRAATARTGRGGLSRIATRVCTDAQVGSEHGGPGPVGRSGPGRTVQQGCQRGRSGAEVRGIPPSWARKRPRSALKTPRKTWSSWSSSPTTAPWSRPMKTGSSTWPMN